MSSKPFSRQNLRKPGTSNGYSVPSPVQHDLALQIDRQLEAVERVGFVEQLSTCCSVSTIGSRPFLKQLL